MVAGGVEVGMGLVGLVGLEEVEVEAVGAWM